MKVFILSKFKIQELENPAFYADHLCEDLLDILNHQDTCVINDRHIAIKKFESDPNLRYLYEMDLVRRLVP